VIGNVDPYDSLDDKKHATRIVMRRAFEDQQDAYGLLETIWSDELTPTSKFKGKKEITSMMRRIVGMGVATGGVWSGNVRALRHVLTMRCSPAAEEEILSVFSRVAKWMRDDEPLLFGDFHQNEQGYWCPRYLKV
jgi:thymidylate synthase ThyX